MNWNTKHFFIFHIKNTDEYIRKIYILIEN